MRFLFYKRDLAWPRSRGHDVHAYHMMRALSRLGHEVSLATSEVVTTDALAGLELADYRSVGGDGDVPGVPGLTALRSKFCSYWGIETGAIARFGELVSRSRPETVVAVGLDGLPFLAPITQAKRVWYAADDPVLASLSQVWLTRPQTWENLRLAAIGGLYQATYRSAVDRAWVVSASDRRVMRWTGGPRAVDVIPNGVDGEFYRPQGVTQGERSCVFWGRLDFGPNVEALQWFCRHVWPELLERDPGATFTIYGFSPDDRVRSLSREPGVVLVPDVPDIREEVSRHQVVVLPFFTGGGIKNKLLEAAALGKAVVCTPRAGNGLSRGAESLPLAIARTPPEWVKAVRGLWDDAGRRASLGRAARTWVLERHSWEAAAKVAAGSVGATAGACVS